MRVLGVLAAVLLAGLPAVSLAGPKPGPAKAQPAKQAKSAQPAKQAKSAQPAKQAKAAQPAKQAKSAQPAKQAKSAQPAKQAKSAQPAKARPAKQAKSAKPAAKPDPLGPCTAALTARKIAWKPASRPGIAHAVEITGPLGGVALSSPSGPLVIDCSLAVSLDEAGRYLRDAGIDAATFSSAYSRRKVRGTDRPSKHSFGLAIDVQVFRGPVLGALHVDRDYEQGLGDAVDCLGRPLTEGGAVLKRLQCQLVRSGLFQLVLAPDFDDAHHDHFHLQVKPWAERVAVRAPAPAIH